MKNILAIGNSFSEDATAYLHKVVLYAGEQTNVVNLYIGGCSLRQHAGNISGDNAAMGHCDCSAGERKRRGA